MGPWHLSEMDAFLRQFKKRSCPVIPVLLPDAPQQPELPIFLAEMSWVDFRKQEPDPLEELIWGITGKRDLSRVGITQGIQPTIPETSQFDDREQKSPIQRELLRLSDSDKDAIVASLLRCPCMSDSNRRESVVKRLPEDIRRTRIKDSRQDIDVENIVDACDNYPGGIEGLITALRFYDGGTFQMQEVDKMFYRILSKH